MYKYISILRGINVSGHKKIKMAELKILYEKLACENVITYIQSGNVIFDHSSADPALLKTEIETSIEKKYRFDVYVDVRKADDFRKTLDEMPFEDIDLEQDGSKILVTFLQDTPENSRAKLLLEYVKEPEKLILANRALYLHCPNGYGKTKLSNSFIENKLKMKATTRNLKTVTKLCELTNKE